MRKSKNELSEEDSKSTSSSRKKPIVENQVKAKVEEDRGYDSDDVFANNHSTLMLAKFKVNRPQPGESNNSLKNHDAKLKFTKDGNLIPEQSFDTQDYGSKDNRTNTTDVTRGVKRKIRQKRSSPSKSRSNSKDKIIVRDHSTRRCLRE